MNENTMNICEMEQELITVRSKYKPYFELENEVRKLKAERMKMLYNAQTFLMVVCSVLLVDLVNKIFF